jgi:hypothetical protein
VRSCGPALRASHRVSYVLHAALVKVRRERDCDRGSADKDEKGQAACEDQDIVDFFTVALHRGILLLAFHGMLSQVPERHRKGACDLHEFF